MIQRLKILNQGDKVTLTNSRIDYFLFISSFINDLSPEGQYIYASCCLGNVYLHRINNHRMAPLFSFVLNHSPIVRE